MIAFSCPSCGARGKVPDAAAVGAKVRCPKCKMVAALPETVAEAPLVPIMDEVGYRCPFCRTSEPAAWKRRRNPLLNLVQIVLVVISFLGLLSFGINLVGVGASSTYVILLAVIGGSAVLSTLIILDYILCSWRQVCPECKKAVSD